MFLNYTPDHILHISYLTHCVVSKDWRHPQLTPNEYIVYMIHNGCMELIEDEHKFVLNPGHILFLLPGHTYHSNVAHACEYDQIHIPVSEFTTFDCSELLKIQQKILENKGYVYQCDPFSTELYDKNQVIIPRDILIEDQTVLFRIKEALQEANFACTSRNVHYKLICSNQILNVFMYISDYFSNRTLDDKLHNTALARNAEKVSGLLSYLHQEYSHKLTGTDITTRMDMNFDYLNRIFKQQSGMTIFTYLNKIRINKAKELLLQGNMKSHEIALSIGCCDEYHFSKMFKKEVGVAPKVWASRETQIIK